jgi:hypothetical protein
MPAVEYIYRLASREIVSNINDSLLVITADKTRAKFLAILRNSERSPNVQLICHILCGTGFGYAASSRPLMDELVAN